jgi:hypothetical protein
MQVSPERPKGWLDDSALTIYTASCDKLEELECSVEERSAELEIMLMDDETPYGGEVQVKAAAFLNMGATTYYDSVERVDRGHGRWTLRGHV